MLVECRTLLIEYRAPLHEQIGLIYERTQHKEKEVPIYIYIYIYMYVYIHVCIYMLLYHIHVTLYTYVTQYTYVTRNCQGFFGEKSLFLHRALFGKEPLFT